MSEFELSSNALYMDGISISNSERSIELQYIPKYLLISYSGDIKSLNKNSKFNILG